MSPKAIFRIALVVILLPILHYTLPQHDIARITGTEVIRQDFSSWNRIFYARQEAGNAATVSRDVLFINTMRRPSYLFGLIRGSEANDVMIYRNEDTGWGWPFYFKFDSRDVQGVAQNYESTAEAPKWVVITHYGWRNRFLTIFPNAISIKPIPSPDVRIIPWANIALLTAFAIVILLIRRAWYGFRKRVLDPAIDRVEDKIDHAEADVAKQSARFWRWIGRGR